MKYGIKMTKKILYAGDSPIGGPSNYLLGILNYLKIEITHIPPGIQLIKHHFDHQYHGIILSDYSKENVTNDIESLIVKQVADGCGLWMIGGWASFTGLNAGWRGSQIEEILPVQCLKEDDRRNIFTGAILDVNKNHPILKGISLSPPPVLCGVNEVLVKPDSEYILAAKVLGVSKLIQYPLLVLRNSDQGRSLALTTDLAPHWCGGLVDWGNQRLKLNVNDDISIEVGDQYVQFVSNMIDWLILK